MKKDKSHYEGFLDKFLSTKIYIHLQNMKPGVYEIRLVYKKKIIKKTGFILK